MCEVSLEAFNALSLERDRYRQQAMWLKTYAETVQAELVEVHNLVMRLQRELDALKQEVLA